MDTYLDSKSNMTQDIEARNNCGNAERNTSSNVEKRMVEPGVEFKKGSAT